MDKEDTGTPGWGASFFMHKEEVAKTVTAAASSANSHRPTVVFSSNDDNNRDSPLQRLQRNVRKALKGFSESREVKSMTYNPEVLTSQKRQWANFQLQHLNHRPLKDPSKLFESMVVVGLHPNCDIQALQRQCIARKAEGSGKLRSALYSPSNARIEPCVEPQVLFVYPPEKQLPLKYKDLLSFCFPGGVEVHAIEKTPSMSELNEIILSQERLKPSDLSFVFRLQVADSSTLYGCCVLVEEIVQKPSRLLSMITDKQSAAPSLGRHFLTTRRCYCILTRLPFFELHFGVLNSIFAEERLERLMKGIDDVHIDFLEDGNSEDSVYDSPADSKDPLVMSNGIDGERLEDPVPGEVVISGKNDGNQENDNHCTPILQECKLDAVKNESCVIRNEDQAINTDDLTTRHVVESSFYNPLLLLHHGSPYESSDCCSSFQDSPNECRDFRTDDDMETEEASFSGQDDSSGHIDILEWAKATKNGSLQILCEYYQLQCPARGSSVKFHPLEHLHYLEYPRPDESALHTAGSIIDLRSCTTSLELAEIHSALWTEEEAAALSTWAVATLCGSLRLENLLTILTGVLLEKQIVFVCSNLGVLSASVLSIIPLIRPFEWQSLLMPVLPDDMLEFLDAPVPYVVGVKNKTSEVQSKLSNVIVVDTNKNQLKSSGIPHLPKQRELLSSLSPYHAKLVGESYLARKRPVYECTDVQVEAAKGFLRVLRSYLDSFCVNLPSHTITNVQSKSDKVSLLLKESFIDSFPNRDRPFMKLFVDTQLFSVHTDLVLSFFQKL